jgi:membrane protein implicated in regulation of membrane protease activity
MPIFENSYTVVWLVIAIAFAGIEVLTTSLGFILASFAALVATSLAWRGFGFEAQVLTFAVITIVSLGLFRPRLLRLMQTRTAKMPGRAEALVGQMGIVTDAIEAGQGRVLVLDQDWAAKSERVIKSSAAIKVVGHDGIVLIVEEVK